MVVYGKSDCGPVPVYNSILEYQATNVVVGNIVFR